MLKSLRFQLARLKSLRFHIARLLHLISIYGYYKKNRHYEPLNIAGNLIEDSKREWRVRWGAISQVIQDYKASTVMDIGCAEGWFLRRAAEDFKCFSIGVEMNDNRLGLGEMIRLYNGSERYAVIKASLSVEDIKKLPSMDVVLCLSVVHHIIKQDGVESGVDFVRALAKRTNKAFVFEMGTSDEKSFEGRMPDMPNGQDDFIKHFLKDAGLTNIRVIDKSESIKKDAVRSIFVAEPVK